MGMRESFKQKSTAFQVAASVLVIGAAVYLMRNAMAGKNGPRTLAYFTTDDGATQFVESIDHFPPFMHGGKTAYRVWMYSTDGGKTMFPLYLERYTPDGLARITVACQDFKAGKTHVPPSAGRGDTEIKKPGAGNPWVNRANLAEAQKIIQFNVPPGADVEVELPE